jgi:uncharacterized protein (UPF0305 family)
MSEQFAEIIAGHFHDILRASGVAMVRVDTHEKIRDAARRMARSIEHQAEQEAIKVFKRLQTAVVDGFNNIEADLREQKETKRLLMEIVDCQNERIENLSKWVANHNKTLDALLDPKARIVVNDKVVKEPVDESAS